MQERTLSVELPGDLETWLFSSLRGNFSIFPSSVPDHDLSHLAQYTDDVGIQPYLRHRLKETGSLKTCPPALQQAFERRRLMEVIIHNLRKEELRCIIRAFHEARIRTLILKGAALSYLIYPEPNLRTYCDFDLFIDPKKKAAADIVLRSMGYERTVRYQFEITYVREEQGVEHILDLHWRLSDSQFLAGEFDFEEIYRRSIPVSALSPWAHTLDAIDSLINACMHMAHHQTWNRLIWLTDVYLLYDQLSDEQLSEFAGRAVKRRCGSICLKALRMTQRVYGIELNHPAVQTLSSRDSIGSRKNEPSDYLLKPSRDWIYEYLYLMLKSSWRDRFKLLWGAIFPPVRSLDQTRYDTRSKIKIPFIYFYRIMIRLPVRLIHTGIFILRRRRKDA